MSTKSRRWFKEVHEITEPNKLVVEPGDQIALSIVRNASGGVAVIVAEDVFKDVDEDAVDKILDCVRETINTARTKAAAPEFVN